MPTRCKSKSKSVCLHKNGMTSPRRGRCPKGSRKSCRSPRGKLSSPRSSSRRKSSRRKSSRRKSSTRRRSSRRRSVPCPSGKKSVCRNRQTGETVKRTGRCKKGWNRDCIDSDDSSSSSSSDEDVLIRTIRDGTRSGSIARMATRLVRPNSQDLFQSLRRASSARVVSQQSPTAARVTSESSSTAPAPDGKTRVSLSMRRA